MTEVYDGRYLKTVSVGAGAVGTPSGNPESGGDVISVDLVAHMEDDDWRRLFCASGRNYLHILQAASWYLQKSQIQKRITSKSKYKRMKASHQQ